MGKTSQMEHSQEDALLVKRALAGGHEAYGTLVEKHQRAAVAFAYGITDDMTLAEDAAQEGFIRAFQALSRLEEPTCFLPWLRTIVRNAATDLLRRRQRTVSLDELADSGFDLSADKVVSPAEELAEGERLKAMQKIINGLRPDYREIIVLRYGEDMSYREIADVLDMKISAVGEKLSRVRNMLREKARRAGVLSRRTSPGETREK